MQENTIYWIFINENFALKFPQLWKIWSHYSQKPRIWGDKNVGKEDLL